MNQGGTAGSVLLYLYLFVLDRKDISVKGDFLCDRKFLSHKKRSAEDAHLAEWYFIAAQYRSGAENLASEIIC